MFAEPPGSYDICEICFWEDDAVQLEYATTLAGGANGITLEQAQLSYLAFAAEARGGTEHTRLPTPGDRRDAEWRPIDRSIDDFADFPAPRHERVPELDERLYYWRPGFWRRNQDRGGRAVP